MSEYACPYCLRRIYGPICECGKIIILSETVRLQRYVNPPKPVAWNVAREPFKWALFLTFLALPIPFFLVIVADRTVNVNPPGPEVLSVTGTQYISHIDGRVANGGALCLSPNGRISQCIDQVDSGVCKCPEPRGTAGEGGR